MILEVKDLTKTFQHPNGIDKVDVLTDLNLQVREGETVAIVGQSGSGKSTLLSLLAGLDHPSQGHIKIASQTLSTLSEETLTRFRASAIGIIFQQFHLMSHLTAVENIGLPLDLARDKNALQKSLAALKQVELDHRAEHFPRQLSGGECQRVAIARALVTRPKLLLGDEPTGNLDPKTGQLIADLLFDLVTSTGMTLVLVTHSEKLAQRCQRVLLLKDGRLQ